MTITSVPIIVPRPEEQSRKSETVEIALAAGTKSWALELQDEEEVRRIPIGITPVVFGSGRQADVRVHDRTVSQRHCEIVVAGPVVGVRDLGSKNGTYVGGARIEEAWGTEGTTITIGQTTLVCVALDDEDED